MASRSRRAVLSLTTRFCLPHEGMTSLDYLSSGSAVVLQASSRALEASSTPSPISVLTCQHVACPWRFPQYFSATWDWLQFVSEDFVTHSLQLLAVDENELHRPQEAATDRPKVLLELPLTPQVQVHEDRDLALLTLDATGVEKWQQVASTLGLQALKLQSKMCEEGDGVQFSGHRQLVRDGQEGFQLPKMVHGHFVGRSSSGQAFAWSQELLEEGMCGGAVIGAAEECAGIVEGIVPPLADTTDSGDVEPPMQEREAHAAWQMRRALAGHVAFIPSADVRAFLEEPGDLILTGMDLPPHM